jgi:hypothetical protein
MLSFKDELAKKATRIEEIKNTLKQSAVHIGQQMSEEEQKEGLEVQLQTSFIGGVPTDQIINVLDGDEEILDSKLQAIDENEEPEKDKLLINSDDSENDADLSSEPDDDEGMDNGYRE